MAARHEKYMESLTKLSKHCRTEIEQNLCTVATGLGVSMPVSTSADDAVDATKVDFLSRLATASGLNLPAFVRLVRGQTTTDPRPNKDLYELPQSPNPALHEIWRRWNKVVAHCVVHEWLPDRPKQQTGRPGNHSSIDSHLPQVWRHIRKGQNDGKYLVVKRTLLDQWQEVFVSPVGIEDKAGAEGPDIRIIDDYSFPEGRSINDFTDRTHLPHIRYNPPCDIAKRIFTLRRDHPHARILLMLGDVAGAFRRVPIHADHAHMFAFVIGELLVIDMACGFGWCGSPAWYFLPGALINGLYGQGPPDAGLDPPLVGSFWCDDHTCTEVDEGLRCFVANLALRRAIATILEPATINERKFTAWSESGRALGLIWNTKKGEVTIPLEKIEKDQQRVCDVLMGDFASKTSLLQLLGSLRHVMTCCPPARSFFQRVQDMATTLSRHGVRKLDEPALEDLKWLRAILTHHDHFNGIPVGHFANVATPIVHVHMDASNDGLCILEPGLRQYIRVRFTEAMQQEIIADASTNSINVRELQSGVLVALLWGLVWSRMYQQRPIHVCYWIDNTSAVSWVHRRLSRQPRAQLYNRLLSLAEFQYSLVCTAKHVPGVLNVMADAGSRAWAADHSLYGMWTNLSYGWTQVPVRTPYDNILTLWAQCSEARPLQTLPLPSIEVTGHNGADSQS